MPSAAWAGVDSICKTVYLGKAVRRPQLHFPTKDRHLGLSEASEWVGGDDSFLKTITTIKVLGLDILYNSGHKRSLARESIYKERAILPMIVFGDKLCVRIVRGEILWMGERRL
mmetsp:Transcript_17952/g.24713  ORF Transcript_17952/g.24713 Transcript_17952/m.24713 type:complete len:114 (-) Transcript_17952:133-474(-)